MGKSQYKNRSKIYRDAAYEVIAIVVTVQGLRYR
jgi:hypothetical protein